MSAVFASFTQPRAVARRLFDRPSSSRSLARPYKPLPCRRLRGHQQVCRASAEAAAFLSAGLEKFVAGDKMGALALFEDCLNKSPSPQDRLAALWNCTCVHAYFGDAEVAQISLREAVALGLDFDSALQGGDPRMVKLQASAQIVIQLRRFAQATVRSLAAGTAQPAPSYGGPAGSRQRTAGQVNLGNKDVSNLTQTDMQGIDTSMIGVVRRVALLLVALIALGVGLFYGGLQLLDAPQ